MANCEERETKSSHTLQERISFLMLGDEHFLYLKGSHGNMTAWKHCCSKDLSDHRVHILHAGYRFHTSNIVSMFYWSLA